MGPIPPHETELAPLPVLQRPGISSTLRRGTTMTFWQLVFEHPVAAFFLICAVCWGVAAIVSAARGD